MLCHSNTLANLTATPLRINSQRSLSAVSAQSQRIRSAFAVQSPRSLRRVAEHGESSANVLQKIIHFHDKKAGKIKEKNFI